VDSELLYTDKKENKNQKGAVAKSFITYGLLLLLNYLRISSYIRTAFLILDFATDPLNFLRREMKKISFSYLLM
jgi:hypothetical protein